MALFCAMTGGEIAKNDVFSPSVACGASSLITGPAGPCRAQPGVSPALGAALREPLGVLRFKLQFIFPETFGVSGFCSQKSIYFSLQLCYNTGKWFIIAICTNKGDAHGTV